MRTAWLSCAVLLLVAGCSVIVPGPDDFTYGDIDAGEVDGGGIDAGPPVDGGADAGDMDGGADGGPACGAGETSCAGGCVDTLVSTEHCGGCGVACDAGWQCRAGSCYDTPVELDSTAEHTCVVRASGAVWCWGTNIDGQIGDGTVLERLSPTEVSGLSGAVDIAVGGFTFRDPNGSSCSAGRAGDVQCWGGLAETIFGSPRSLVPVAVPGLPPMSRVAVSTRETCASTVTNRLWCWGAPVTPGPVEGPVEVLAPGLGGVWLRHLDTSVNHTCAVSMDGRVFCRGNNFSGQLGVPVAAGSSDTLLQLTAISGAAQVATSTGATCVLADSGTVQCLGLELALGVGSTSMDAQHLPQTVPGISDADVIEAAVWGYGTCVIRGADRRVTCWGMDPEATGGGALWASATAPDPIDIPGLTGAVRVAVGAEHVCALTDAGEVRCIGGNFYGQLGDGTTMTGRDSVYTVMLP